MANILTIPDAGGPAAGRSILNDNFSALNAELETKAPALHSHSAATTGAAGFMAAADKAKLDAIATGATANATDAQLRDRSTHTGTQAIATISGLQPALDGKQAAGSYAPTSHSHAIADTSGLQAALDAKAATGHTHSDLHTHANKSTLDKVTEAAGLPLWNGSPWPGGVGGGVVGSKHKVDLQLNDTGWPNFTGGFFATGNNGEFQKITGFTEVIDESSAWDTTNNEYTCPEAGEYLLIFIPTMVSDMSNGRRGEVAIRKNSTTGKSVPINTIQDDNTRQRGAAIVFSVTAAANDVLSFFYSVYQSPTRLSVWATIVKI